MIKSHEEECVLVESIADEIICNHCGGSYFKNEADEFDDCLSINKAWGYLSEFDKEVHKFHICQSCYKKWIASFKIPVEIEVKEIGY